jgi:hypothetical protein
VNYFLFCIGVLFPMTGHALPKTEIQFLFGEVQIRSATGEPLGSAVSLSRREITRSQKRIAERIIHIPTRGPVKEYETKLQVRGRKFTIHDNAGDLNGTGTFQGTPWAWKKWDYSAKTNHGRVKVSAATCAAGIHVEKTFYDPKGRVRLIYAEDWKPISRESFENLSSRLLPSPMS